MKTAVIFYSYEGNTALIAELIKTAINADVFEIKTMDSKKRSGFFKIAWGVSQVLFKKKPVLLPLSVNVNAYDLIILGTPVWASSPAPALVSFLDKTKINGKKIALYCCHGGGKGEIFSKLKALLPGNTFAGEIDFLNPAKNEDTVGIKQKIEQWLKTLN
jgi:flavodoxin